MVICSVTANFKEISKFQEILWGTEHVQTGYLSPFIHNSLGTKLKLPWREGGTKGEREGKKGGRREGGESPILELKPSYFLQERQQLIMWLEWATAWQVSRLLWW